MTCYLCALVCHFLLQNKDFTAACKKQEPPRLVICEERGQPTSGWILCDGIAMECDVDDVLTMVVRLLQVYYAWDLSYPKQYQLLGFVQQCVFADTKNKFYKSAAFKDTEAAFDAATGLQ